MIIIILLFENSFSANTSSLNCCQYNHSPDWSNWPNSDCLELPKCLNLPSSYETCKNCEGKLLGYPDMNMICVPSFFKQALHEPPSTRVPVKDEHWDSPLITLYTKLENIQVIAIGTHTITVSMLFKVYWFDYRLKEWNYQHSTSINLSKEDKNFIWLPEIDIANNMVSKKEQGEKIFMYRFHNTAIPLVFRRFYLRTTVNCEMDFQNFPFDKHICNLEVGCI